MAIRPEETKILVAIPCYGQVMKTPFVISLMQLTQRLAQHKINFGILIFGDSLIPRARNNFASVILHDPQYSHMLFLDCDIEFPPDAILHMLDMEKDIIGTAYTRKNINWSNIAEAAKAGMEPQGLPEVGGNLVAVSTGNTPVEYGEPLKVTHAGTGLMLIRRTVFERMRDAYPELKYELGDNEPGKAERKVAWDFFACMIDPDAHILLSEDSAFCRRASAVGIETWLLTCYRTVHWGDYGFVFNMDQLARVGLLPVDMGAHAKELARKNGANDPS
ncbi:MAG TPA: hypothetical protein VMO17_00105 [Terriglobia bacterium]|nr:hypothetical protein [Terriglobia bacterium]